MKKTYYAVAGACAALAVLLLAAAVPSQTDFDATYFQTNTLPISLRGNLTNWSKLGTNVITSGGGGTVGTMVNTGASTARAVPVFSGTDGTNTVPSGALIDSSNRLTVGDGTVGLPSLSFTSDPDIGFYRRGNNTLTWVTSGTDRMEMSGSALRLASDGSLAFSSGAIGTGTDTILLRGAANTLEMRNGVNAQTLLIDGTYSGASDYVRLSLGATSTATTIAATTAGTGADNVDINLTPAGTGTVKAPLYQITGTGAQVIFGSTNTAPSGTATPTKWISVTVVGEAAVYRIPLYE